ncbi:FAD/NAD(P)-binding domain-containing protein [Auriculariales sp. MPI-PUGE-AT-0066]|nr:FAD/NAD(P)-binding domain-containing protein [Auriculariales sp. MPI-PUGE-AT-0066]
MDAPLPPTCEVIIVGAGPSGLACALGLAARNIPFILVDARDGGHAESRAVIMHANALEALETVDNSLVNDIMWQGIKSPTITALDTWERPIFNIDMSSNSAYTKYNFILFLHQHTTEAVMRNHLARRGIQVQYGHRVVGVHQGSDGWSVEFQSGKKVTARYVVAADGSNSLVRAGAGISYLNPYTKADGTLPSSDEVNFIVADVQLADPVPANVPRDRIQMMVGVDGNVLIAPVIKVSEDGTKPKDTNLFRLYIAIPGTPPQSPSEEYVQRILDTRGPGSHSKQYAVPRIAKLLGSARFRTQPALADRFVQRASGAASYILLIGDAAHKHGPAGGQGMNMGICDGLDKDEIFQAFSLRRKAIARETIDFVEGMMELDKGGAGWGPWLRIMGLWFFTKVPGVASIMAWRVSGLQHRKK